MFSRFGIFYNITKNPCSKEQGYTNKAINRHRVHTNAFINLLLFFIIALKNIHYKSTKLCSKTVARLLTYEGNNAFIQTNAFPEVPSFAMAYPLYSNTVMAIVRDSHSLPIYAFVTKPPQFIQLSKKLYHYLFFLSTKT